MAIDINVSVEKLDGFYVRIDEFQKNILDECTKLESAVGNLKRENSEADIRSICNMVDSVRSTIQSEKATFESLKKIVENYSKFVKRVKKIVSSNK